jgi:hypothetical protein
MLAETIEPPSGLIAQAWEDALLKRVSFLL